MKKIGILISKTSNLLILILMISCNFNDSLKNRKIDEYPNNSPVIYSDSSQVELSNRKLEITMKISDYVKKNLNYPKEALEKNVTMDYTVLTVYAVKEDSSIYIGCQSRSDLGFENEAKSVLYDAIKLNFDTIMIGKSKTYPIVFKYKELMGLSKE